MDDFLIVKALKKGDEKAFDKLYKKYKNLVFFVIIDIVKNKLDAEEILQDVFVCIYNKINSFDGSNFKAWLLIIAKNKALDFYRTKKNNIEYDDNKLNELVYRETNCDDIYYDLKNILSYDEFMVLILSAVYDIKHKDIGAYLNKPTGTISYLYYVACKKAKEKMKEGSR